MIYKYEYLLKTWGGFYNEHNIKIHKIKESKYEWFDTKEKRDKAIKLLRGAEAYAESKGSNDCTLCISLSEGYTTRYRQKIKAIVIDEGEIKHVENDLGYGFFSDKELQDVACADYFKEWKYDTMRTLSDDHELLFSTLVLE